MEIRRNQEGNMLYIDGKEMVEAAIEQGILQQEEKDGITYVAVYMGKGDQGPEGWYMVEKEEVIQMLIRDDEGIKCLYDALLDKGIEFKPSFDVEMFNLINHVFCDEQGPLTSNSKICPVCGRAYTEEPAISRKDGSDICPDCGTAEALEDAKMNDSVKEEIMECVRKARNAAKKA